MRKIILSIIVFICLIKDNVTAQYWSALGEGIYGGIYSSGVHYSSAVYNGELYIGGSFDTVGGIPIKNIAKWNGTCWSPVGSGIQSYNSNGSFVLSLKVYNGELYAGGLFDTAGGVPVKNIAKWNGTNWSPVGTGITSSTMDQPVYSIIVHNGMLYAAGHFDTAGGIPAKNIAKWDGANWSPIGTGINGRVSALVSYNGSLYAGGNFTAADGIAARCIAKWDGANWSPLGTGINDYGVFCLAVYNDALYAGGWFTVAGGVAARGVAKWDGMNWSSIGNETAGNGVGMAVLSMFVYNGDLYIGGSLTAQHECIAKWNGVNWSYIGNGIGNGIDDYSGASVWSISEYNGDMYAGGGFHTAGNVYVNNIAKWANQCSIAPPQPGNINGNSTVCQNSQVTLSIGSVNDAADFTWTLPPGWSGSSNSNSITAKVGVNGGTISVVANNPCGSSIAQTLMVTVTPPLPQPGAISGNETVCWNSTQTYSISPVTGANSYIWILPDWWTGNSTTNSITATAAESGNISVVAVNNYCTSDPQTFFVTVNYFPNEEPGSIIGNNSVCHGSTLIYSINPVNGATSYTWALPPGWTGNSTTNSITAKAELNGGTISVIANYTCGSSSVQSLDVSILQPPQQPGLINGNDTVCAGATQTYSIASVPDATHYSWVLPNGWSGNSTSNSINVTAGTNNGMISVVANNSCGASLSQTKMLITTSAPAMPSFITGNDTVCEGSSQTYYIDPVPGATAYTWDLTFGTAFGFDSTTITITALHSGYSDDFITVSAYNNCGNSDMFTLPVKVKLLPQPPGRITGNSYVCPGTSQTFLSDTEYDATSYTWIIPQGWIGNSNTSTINVTVGNDAGDIKVKANNSCGSGAFTSLPVQLDTNPPKPGTITGNIYVVTGEKHSYSVDVTNRPLSYNWSLSGGGNITAGQSLNKIEIDWQTPGTYVLFVNAHSSCGVSTDQTLTIKVSGANVEDPYSLQLFPNPSSGQFYMKAKRVQNKVINVEVLNMAGQLAFRSGKKQGANDYTQLINLDKMPQGIYVVKIMVDDKVYLRSVVINN